MTRNLSPLLILLSILICFSCTDETAEAGIVGNWKEVRVMAVDPKTGKEWDSPDGTPFPQQYILEFRADGTVRDHYSALEMHYRLQDSTLQIISISAQLFDLEKVSREELILREDTYFGFYRHYFKRVKTIDRKMIDQMRMSQ